eukprot:XP_019920676.1 PREDICTED: uncharacterized protein LOC105322964 [Crassostrea gigas]
MAAPFRNCSRLAANLRSKLPSVVNGTHSNHGECLRNRLSAGISVKRADSIFCFYNQRTFTLSQTNVNRRQYSTISERTCWKCGNKVDNNEELFFCKCGVVQDIKGLTFFELMGIPESFDIDVTSLTQKYRDLQRQLHPDKHTLKSEETPAENPFVWLTDPLLRGPRIDLIREIQLPISTTPLADFLDLAVEKLELNAGPAILSWAAMYSLQLYRKWMAEVRHINLPVLYGPPTAGKTTIAQCGAWLNGCSEIHIASRCTLAFVTQWITTSSVPFVWDDPTTSEEVAQLAVDLGNGAVRGKATEDPKTPLTGCLVTANFDLSCLLKYFSRLFVMKINKTQRKKQTGEAKTLEDAAMTASCALPLVLQELNKTTINDIQEAVTAIEFDTDIRILEGIALPLVCAKKILRLVGRGQYLEKVTDYIQEVLKPYYLETLESCAAPGETSVTKPAPDFRRCVIQTIVTNAHCLDEVTLVKGSLVAIRANIIPRNIQKQMTEMAKTNQTARFQGKPRKCLTIGRDMFSEEEWGLILKAIDGHSSNKSTVMM